MKLRPGCGRTYARRFGTTRIIATIVGAHCNASITRLRLQSTCLSCHRTRDERLWAATGSPHPHPNQRTRRNTPRDECHSKKAVTRLASWGWQLVCPLCCKSCNGIGGSRSQHCFVGLTENARWGGINGFIFPNLIYTSRPICKTVTVTFPGP